MQLITSWRMKKIVEFALLAIIACIAAAIFLSYHQSNKIAPKNQDSQNDQISSVTDEIKEKQQIKNGPENNLITGTINSIRIAAVSAMPAPKPSMRPTTKPTSPTAKPSPAPSPQPTASPTPQPTYNFPTSLPTSVPSTAGIDVGRFGILALSNSSLRLIAASNLGIGADTTGGIAVGGQYNSFYAFTGATGTAITNSAFKNLTTHPLMNMNGVLGPLQGLSSNLNSGEYFLLTDSSGQGISGAGGYISQIQYLRPDKFGKVQTVLQLTTKIHLGPNSAIFSGYDRVIVVDGDTGQTYNIYVGSTQHGAGHVSQLGKALRRWALSDSGLSWGVVEFSFGMETNIVYGSLWGAIERQWLDEQNHRIDILYNPGPYGLGDLTMFAVDFYNDKWLFYYKGEGAFGNFSQGVFGVADAQFMLGMPSSTPSGRPSVNPTQNSVGNLLMNLVRFESSNLVLYNTSKDLGYSSITGIALAAPSLIVSSQTKTIGLPVSLPNSAVTVIHSIPSPIIASDTYSSKAYALADFNMVPLSSSGGPLHCLIPVTAAGLEMSISGRIVYLKTPLWIAPGSAILSGYNRIVIIDGDTLIGYDIQTPSGAVTYMGRVLPEWAVSNYGLSYGFSELTDGYQLAVVYGNRVGSIERQYCGVAGTAINVVGQVHSALKPIFQPLYDGLRLTNGTISTLALDPVRHRWYFVTNSNIIGSADAIVALSAPTSLPTNQPSSVPTSSSGLEEFFFSIVGLFSTNAKAIELGTVLGDNSIGGIALAKNGIILTGGLTSIELRKGFVDDSSMLVYPYSIAPLASDFRRKFVYVLADAHMQPISKAGDVITYLLKLNPSSGQISNGDDSNDYVYDVVRLKQTIKVGSDSAIFSGYDRIMFANGDNGKVFSIFPIDGKVTYVGKVLSRWTFSDSELVWGVNEFSYNKDVSLDYGCGNGIERQSIVSSEMALIIPGTLEQLFSGGVLGLGDLTSFTVDMDNSLWYFTYRGIGVFGDFIQGVGYARASIALAAPSSLPTGQPSSVPTTSTGVVAHVFAINHLTMSGLQKANVSSSIGDDACSTGMVVSSDQLFVTGCRATLGLDKVTLQQPLLTKPIFAMAMNLNGLYAFQLLDLDSIPITGNGGKVAYLQPLNQTGPKVALVTCRYSICLPASISIGPNSLILSGWDRIVIACGATGKTYNIYIARANVAYLGKVLRRWVMADGELTFGVSEFSIERKVTLVYGTPGGAIERQIIGGSASMTNFESLFSDSRLGDIPSFAVDTSINRWYFYNKVHGSFSNFSSTVSSADAIFSFYYPTGQPTEQPSGQPSAMPSAQPSCQPSSPTSHPTRRPSGQPSSTPTRQPSKQPIVKPSSQPSRQPTAQPSTRPSRIPTSQPLSKPSLHPSAQPSRRPTSQPSRQPFSRPSVQPSKQPSRLPTRQPSRQPSSQPTRQPIRRPSAQPSRHPSSQPTRQPIRRPTSQPTSQPSLIPSGQPSRHPTGQPSRQPTRLPTAQPTRQPTRQPTSQPTRRPSCQPSRQPSCHPSVQPSIIPTMQPSRQPSRQPTSQPSRQPTTHPSRQPTRLPTTQPSTQPSRRPSSQPSEQPTRVPTNQPSSQPSSSPTAQPTDIPSMQPSNQPSRQPSNKPSTQPSYQPSGQPSSLPSRQPSLQPFSRPSAQPSLQPSRQPTRQPTSQPSRYPTNRPSCQPSRQPSSQPSRKPTDQPLSQPTSRPSSQPTRQPSLQPTSQPSRHPTNQPTLSPTLQPNAIPTSQPSSQPMSKPTGQPSLQPTFNPSMQPSSSPTSQPTSQPSMQPSRRPTRQPSLQPVGQPSSQPSRQPSSQPTRQPSFQPITQPTGRPSRQPSCQPTRQPTSKPTLQPRNSPSSQPSRQPFNLPTGQPSRQPSRQPTRQPFSKPSSQPSRRPSSQPSLQPSRRPSMRPSSQPIGQPTNRPSRCPSGQPSRRPTRLPSSQPSRQPIARPSAHPSRRPSRQPTRQPTGCPSKMPSKLPSAQPTRVPLARPSGQPTRQPLTQPTAQPSRQPVSRPTSQPSRQPTSQPTKQPFSHPTGRPSHRPTSQPTRQPTKQPISRPTRVPTLHPTMQPSRLPSSQPSKQPTCHPTSQPSRQPSQRPSYQPTSLPSSQPTKQPISKPSNQPTAQPSLQPSCQPSGRPSSQPSAQPISRPSAQPSAQPASRPSMQPSRVPTSQPSSQPIARPTTQPSTIPTSQPSSSPSTIPTDQPTGFPSVQPTVQPSSAPTEQPTSKPSCIPISQPSSVPSLRPSSVPSLQPSSQPSLQPTRQPTSDPTEQPSSQPSCQPSSQPSYEPSKQPSSQPTHSPTGQPSFQPSIQPTQQPTSEPSSQPSLQPTIQPSVQPTSHPTLQPSCQPTQQPSCQPTLQPTSQPTSQPSRNPTCQPSGQPTSKPSMQPSSQPSYFPTCQPTSRPSQQPSVQPTSQPTLQPTSQPSMQPSSQPSVAPSTQPSSQPSSIPTFQPSSKPSMQPSLQPTSRPTAQPTTAPSMQPTSQPSTQPSAQPSSQPSIQPTRIPTSQPSRQPSRQPTSQPSRQPSVRPTSQPTRVPSSQPSRQPTMQPSSQPSRQPVRRPTGQPSRHPTGQPTRQPTRTPTVQPTRTPTRQPTSRPSRVPTAQPSRQPSRQPSSRPSLTPTSLPSMQPSLQPFSKPSSTPTLQPSSKPSRIPSTQPSKQPSRQPTSKPTSAPSSQPSSKPSHLPSSQPSRAPFGQPTSLPSRRPTAQPSRQPSSQPLSRPSRAPTGQPSRRPLNYPSAQPTRAPFGQPTSRPSRRPSGQPSKIPSRHPSSQPTRLPTSQPYSRPSKLPSGQPTSSPTAEPSVRSAIIVYIVKVNITQTLDGASVSSFKAPDTAAAFSQTVVQILLDYGVENPSVSDFRASTTRRRLFDSVFGRALQSSSTVTLRYTVTALTRGEPKEFPAYLVSLLNLGINSGNFTITLQSYSSALGASSLADASAVIPILGSRLTITKRILTPSPTASPSSQPTGSPTSPPTTALYRISFISSPRSVYGALSNYATNTENVYAFRVQMHPQKFIVVRPTLNGTFSSLGGVTMIPDSFTFKSTSSADELIGQFVLSADATISTSVLLGLNVSGPSRNNYFETSSVSVLVLPSRTIVPPPSLASAQFANGGSIFYFTFNTPTDFANMTATVSWSCSKLFKFASAASASCVWLTTTVIQGTYGSYGGLTTSLNLIMVGSAVTLLPKKVRVSCVPGTDCSANLLSAGNTMKMIRPASAFPPVIVFNVQKTVSICDNLVMDVSASTGNYGRRWLNTTRWFVSANSTSLSHKESAVSIMNFLNNATTNLFAPIVIPNRLLKSTSYIFRLGAQNFFGDSVVSTVAVAVSKSVNVPQAVIPGTPYATISVTNPVSLAGMGQLSSCSNLGNVSLQFVWIVTNNGVPVVGLNSTSRNPRNLLLPPYSLAPQAAAYRVTLQVKAVVNATVLGSSSYSISVSVTRGPVMSAVAGGSSKSTPVDAALVLDGSASSDQNYPPGSPQSTNIIYAWTCQLGNVGQQYAVSCGLHGVPATVTTPVLRIPPYTMLTNVTYIYTLRVTAPDGRFGSQSIVVTTSAPNSVFVGITAPSVNANPTAKFTLQGTLRANYSVTAAWYVKFSSMVSLPQALTPLNAAFSVDEASRAALFPLAYPPNTFVPGRLYTFILTACPAGAQLTCSYSEVSVLFNVLPYGGFVQSSPVNGTALSTLFTVSTSNWMTDISSYPLYYAFAYQANPTAPILSIQSTSLQMSAITLLPAGSNNLNFQVQVWTTVSDINGGTANASRGIRVALHTTADLTGVVAAAVQSLSVVANVETLNQAINVVASTLNYQDCSKLPSSCASLKRYACGTGGANVCGSCMAGYVGVVGPSNTACSKRGRAASIGSTCALNSDCMYGLCNSDGTCGNPLQSCPSNNPASVCSNHGICSYFDTVGQLLSSPCTILDTNCVPTCMCDSGYGGADCSLNSTALAKIDKSRTALCQAITTSISFQDLTPRLVDSVASSLLSSFAPDQVASDSGRQACAEVLSFLSVAASQGYLTGTQPSTIQYYAQIVSGFVNQSAVNSTTALVEDSIASLAAGVFSGMVGSERPAMITSSGVRLKLLHPPVSSLANATLTPPPLASESWYGKELPGVTFPGAGLSVCDFEGQYAQVSIMQWGSNPYGDAAQENVQSNVLRLASSGLRIPPSMPPTARPSPVPSVTPTRSPSVPPTRNPSPAPSAQPTSHAPVMPIAASRELMGSISVHQKQSPAYFLTFPFSSRRSFNISSLTTNFRKMNLTMPECTYFDGEKYIPCNGCNVSSFSEYNVTFACFDLSILCGGSGSVQATRRLQSMMGVVHSAPQPDLFGTASSSSAAASPATQMTSVAVYGAKEVPLLAIMPLIIPHPIIDYGKGLPVIIFFSLLLFTTLIGIIWFLRWDDFDLNYAIYLRQESLRTSHVKSRTARYKIPTYLEGVYVSMRSKKVAQVSQSKKSSTEPEASTLSPLSASAFTDTFSEVDSARSDRFPIDNLYAALETSFFSDVFPAERLDMRTVQDCVGRITLESNGDLNAKYWKDLYLDHPWTTMFYSYSARSSRTIRWIALARGWLLSIFMQSLFFRVVFPDGGFCNAIDTRVDCLVPQSLVPGAGNLCQWNPHSRLCSLVPPPSGVLFNVNVALMSICSVIVIDFIFGYITEKYAARKPAFSLSAVEMKKRAELPKPEDGHITVVGVNDAEYAPLRELFARNNVIEKMRTLSASEIDAMATSTFEDFRSAEAELNYILETVKQFITDDVESQKADRIDPRKEWMIRAMTKRLKMIPQSSDVSLMDKVLKRTPYSKLLFDLTDTRNKAEVIKKEILKMDYDGYCDHKDALLMQHFVLEQVPRMFRFALRKHLFQFKTYVNPRTVNSLTWCLSWIFLLVTGYGMIVVVYIIWSRNTGATLFPWGVVLAIATVEDVFLIQPAKIYITNVVALGAIGPQLRAIHRTLHVIATAYMQDGLDRNSDFRVVQHFNAACRVARMESTYRLPAAFILRQVDDLDDEVCRRGRDSKSAIGMLSYMSVWLPSLAYFVDERFTSGLAEFVIAVSFTCFIVLNLFLYWLGPIFIAIPYLTISGYWLYHHGLLRPSLHRVQAMQLAKKDTTKNWRQSKRAVAVHTLQEWLVKVAGNFFDTAAVQVYTITKPIVSFDVVDNEENFDAIAKANTWKFMNSPIFCQGKVMDEADSAQERALYGAEEEALLGEDALAAVAFGLPKEIKAMTLQLFPIQEISDLRAKAHQADISRIVFGTKPLDDPFANPGVDKVVHFNDFSGEKSMKFRAAQETTDVFVALARILMPLGTVSVASLAALWSDEEYVTTHLGQFGVDDRVFVKQLRPRYIETWDVYYPGGYILSPSDKADLLNKFDAWLESAKDFKSQSAVTTVHFGDFVKWFILLSKSIVAEKRSMEEREKQARMDVTAGFSSDTGVAILGSGSDWVPTAAGSYASNPLAFSSTVFSSLRDLNPAAVDWSQFFGSSDSASSSSSSRTDGPVSQGRSDWADLLSSADSDGAWPGVLSSNPSDLRWPDILGGDKESDLESEEEDYDSY